jgi:hypothetical protein
LVPLRVRRGLSVPSGHVDDRIQDRGAICPLTDRDESDPVRADPADGTVIGHRGSRG